MVGNTYAELILGFLKDLAAKGKQKELENKDKEAFERQKNTLQFD